MSKTNTELSFIETDFTDQNSKPLEIEDNVNMTLIIGRTEDRKNIEMRY